jgi:hypothetical protein
MEFDENIREMALWWWVILEKWFYGILRFWFLSGSLVVLVGLVRGELAKKIVLKLA